MSDHDPFFRAAADVTREALAAGSDQPFGAALVRNGEIVVVCANSMAADTDPTAHAELLAGREGAQLLGTLDLSDCVMYATGQPCPMCTAAMIWAGIPTVYYATPAALAHERGYSDVHVRDYLAGRDDSAITEVHVPGRAECDELWRKAGS